LSADNAPGFNFSSPHGVSFVADPAPAIADKDGHDHKEGTHDWLASYANQVSAFGSLISSSLTSGPGESGGNVIADAHNQPPVMAIPHNHG
jgi:hypothetical protein